MTNARFDDLDEPAINFLERLRPGGPWMLSAIVPDGAIETITARKAADVRAFVRKYEGSRNLYYGVNPPRRDLNSKAAKTDIAAIEYALADLDPNSDEGSAAAKARYLEQLKTFAPKPTAIIDSGNGIQLLWRLGVPIVLPAPQKKVDEDGKPKLVYSRETQAQIDDVEARIKAVMLRLGAKPGTQNIDRILRLPGTTNLPNEKKRKEGRGPCPTLLLEFNDTSHPLTAFPLDEDSWGGISIGLRSRMLLYPEIMRRWRGDKTGLKDQSRSALDMSLGALLKARGFSFDDMRKVLRYFEHGQRTDKHRDIKRIWDRANTASEATTELIDKHIERFNKDHAVVLMDGGQVVIMRELAGQPPQFMSPENFHLWHANDKVDLDDKKPVSRIWVTHAARRQYSRVVFDPRDTNQAHYNLWRGFSVQPDPGKSCDKFLAHVRDNICSGNPVHFLWVMGFLAHMVQRPEEKPGVSLVLRGSEGVGKGFFANAIGKLCLHHFVVISQATHLTGRFNSQFLHTLLAFVDEAFWAGDRSGEGALKHLVTDEYVTIEGKYKDPITVRNLSRLIIASNEKWVVPAGVQARRWCVLDVADTHANDRAYFRAIADELGDGGGLMHHLMSFDLGSVDVHTTPKTAALLEQKEESLLPHAQWWLETLGRGTLRYPSEDPDAARGTVSEGHCWPTDLPKDRLWESYRLWMQQHNIKSRVLAVNMLHRWFKTAKLLPGADEYRPHGEKRRLKVPTLPACRTAFDTHVGQPAEWDDA
jgi:hypothetical protein